MRNSLLAKFRLEQVLFGLDLVVLHHGLTNFFVGSIQDDQRIFAEAGI